MSLFKRIREDEDGFSLTELLTAMVIGSIVLISLMTLMTTGFTKSAEVTDRADTAQRSRIAMDRIVTLLDSEVCLDPISAVGSVPPIIGAQGSVVGSGDQYVAFYADLNGVSESPDRYELTYSPTARTLTERRYDGVGALPNITFPSLTQTRMLADQVVPARDANGAVLPIFRYYAYESDGTINYDSPMATPLQQTVAPQVVRVVVTFKVISQRTKVEDARSTTLEGQSAVGTPDPSTPNAGSCP